jgi:hypothetical protein
MATVAVPVKFIQTWATKDLTVAQKPGAIVSHQSNKHNPPDGGFLNKTDKYKLL